MPLNGTTNGSRYHRRSKSNLDLPLYAEKGLQRAWQTIDSTKSTIGRARKDPAAFTNAALLSLKRKLFTVTSGLIIVWLLVLYWGEVYVFAKDINSCDWSSWEQWPAGAVPHRITLVADPQLVDPHTYPGRPWPLSTLTIKHTDVYLRRAYSRIQRDLDPHTVLFLGDLFDGGREWGTLLSHSPEEQYHRYGRLFWQKEYDRFAHIFLKERGGSQVSDTHRADGRRLITSLPGNHDLGFGRGIQLPVRGRFRAYFGEGNRLDVIGNHTFVCLDTVSLSAQEQAHAHEEIWRPAFDMLNNLEQDRNNAVNRHLQHLFDEPEVFPEPHNTKFLDLADASSAALIRKTSLPKPLSKETQPTLPTILLTHVPLYRPSGTNCGPLRERGSAISISAGYQYQNTLSIGITDQIIDNVNRDGTLQHVFSGDDHDYCEIVHDTSTSKAGESNIGKPGMAVGKKIREITVKSISWAMGVRRPGFLLVSLWNPIDVHGKPLPGTVDRTIQTHLCLLPDQLSILIRYGILFGISLLILFIRAVAIVAMNSDVPDADASFTLPRINTTISTKKEKDEAEDDFPTYTPASATDYTATTAKSSSTAEANARSAARPRSNSLRTGNAYAVSNASPPNLSFNFSPLDDQMNAPREKENGSGVLPPRRSSKHLTNYTSFYGIGIGTGTKKRNDSELDEESGFTYDHDYAYRSRSRRITRRHRQGCQGVLLEFRDGLWGVARIVLLAFGVALLY